MTHFISPHLHVENLFLSSPICNLKESSFIKEKKRVKDDV